MKEFKGVYVSDLRFDNSCVDDEVRVSGCIIGKLVCPGIEFMKHVTIERCIIDELEVTATWFAGGLLFRNNVVKQRINYEMGGHNKSDFVVEYNVFEDFVDFFDCIFEGQVIVNNNIFKWGTSLIAEPDKPWANSFIAPPIIKNNIGVVNISSKENLYCYEDNFRHVLINFKIEFLYEQDFYSWIGSCFGYDGVNVENVEALENLLSVYPNHNKEHVLFDSKRKFLVHCLNIDCAHDKYVKEFFLLINRINQKDIGKGNEPSFYICFS